MNRDELLIEPHELAAMLDDPDLRLYDATVLFQPVAEGTAHDHYLERHIPGAAFFDHNRVSDQHSKLMFMVPGEVELASALGELGIGNDNNVVFYATSQLMWATRAWWLLRYAGHTRVRVFNGTLENWSGELQSGESLYPAATFKTSLNPAMFASRDDVLAAMEDGATCTVNALPHEFYTGDTEVPYAKNGHITGSVSHPYSELMDGHQLKPDDDLKKIFTSRVQQEKLITYCGGGVAATLNAAAALIAGIPDVRVYDGSLSEWNSLGLPTTRGDVPG